MALSEELRNEFAQIAPDRQLLPLRRGVRALPRQRRLASARDGRRRPSRPGELGCRSAGVRAPARARRALGDPHLPAAGVRPGDPVSTARRGRRARARGPARGRCALGLAGAARAAAERVVGRSCCRGAYIRGALLGGGLALRPARPHLELRTASLAVRVHRRRRRARGREDACRRAADHAVAYAKGHETIGDVLAIAGAGRGGARARGACGGRGTARARTASRTQTRRISCARPGRPRSARGDPLARASTRSDQLVEIAELRLRHPSASLRELAAKARPPLTKAAAHRRLNASCAWQKMRRT